MKRIYASNEQLNESVKKIGKAATLEKYGCSESTIAAASTGRRKNHGYKKKKPSGKICHSCGIRRVNEDNRRTSILCDVCFKTPSETCHTPHYVGNF